MRQTRPMPPVPAAAPEAGEPAPATTRSRRLGALTLVAWLLLSPTGIVWAGPVADAAMAGRTPTVTTTPSGQALVNIAAPNAAGLSHNRYQRFDVDAGGLLLNNSRSPIGTALGTQIGANPNLGSRSASLIVNEVVTALPSSLNGPLAVLGDSARLVIANPNGIACNGCAFVNTSHVSLATGAVRFLDAPNGGAATFDTATALAFEVRGGRIEIGGPGLAAPLDRLDLIAQTLKIAAPIDIGSGALNLIAGRQSVDHETLARIANVAGNDRAGIGEDFAIDATVLGAMNAGQIKLIATPAGMGVRSAVNLAASSGDLILGANGDLSLKRADAARNVSITGPGALTHAGILAGRDLAIDAATVDNRNQTVAAQGNARLTAPALDNRGGRLLAGGQLTVETPGAALELGDGTLMGGSGATVRAASIGNRGSFTHAAALELIADTAIANSGTLLGGARVALTAGTRLDNSGTLGAVGALDLAAADLANSGRLQADGAFTARLTRLANSGTATLIGGDGSRLTLTDTLSNNGLLASTGSLELSAPTIINTGRIEAAGRLALAATAFSNSGSLLSHGDLALTSDGFANSGGIDAENDAAFTLGAGAGNAGGTLSAGRDLTLATAKTGNFGGSVAAGRDLVLNLGDYTHATGETDFLAGQDLRLTATRFTNSAMLEAWRDLHLTVSGALTNGGQLLSGNDLTVNAGSLSNAAGTLEAGRDLSITAGSLANGGGGGTAAYVADSLSGYVSNVLAYVADPLVQQKLFNEAPPDWFWKNSRVTLNNRASLYLDSGLSAPVFTLTLTRAGVAATLSAGRNLSASASGTLANRSSLITAGGDIRITAERFDNLAATDIAEGNIFAGGGGHELRAYTAAGALIQAAGSLSVAAPTQTNSGTLAGASVYLGGTAITNGLTDYRYATPANTLPGARLDLGAALPGAASLPGVTFTPRAASLFQSTSRLALLSGPAGSVNEWLPESLRNTGSPFLLDARLEQQAIREAALKESGRASFLAMNDPGQERARLLEAAARYAGANGIRLGVALSDEQIARLAEPLLWYETQTVTGPDGERYGALVPRVYLPEARREALAQLNGGLIQAGTLDIRAERVRNTGYLSAATLNLKAATLTNEKRSAEWGRYTANVAGGTLEVWGDRVQPGGFLSAAKLNLEAERIESISGAFLEAGADQAAALQQARGANFSQSENIDRTYTQFQAKRAGLKQLAILAVAAVAALYTAGAASAALAGAAESSALAAGATATAAEAAGVAAANSAWGVALSGAAGGLAANATTQLLSTGRLDAGQLFKAGATAALTAGLLNAPLLEGGQSLNQLAGIQDVAGTGNRLAGFDLDRLGDKLAGMAARGGVNAGVNQLVYGKQAGSFGNAFRQSVISDLAAVGANAMGVSTDVHSIENIGGHALLGAAAAKLQGKDAVAGALGGATAAVLNPLLDPYTSQTDSTDRTVQHVAASMLASGAITQVLGRDGVTAAHAAQNETLNNYLTKENIEQKQARLARAQSVEEKAAIIRQYIRISGENDRQAFADLKESVMAVSALQAERDKLQAQISGPTACAADFACRSDVGGSISQINGILNSANAGKALEPFVIAGEAALAVLGGAELIAAKYGMRTVFGLEAGKTAGANSGLRTSAAISAERAEAFLVKNGMPADRAASYVASFDGPITARLVRPGEDFLRYTDMANSSGSFLTKTPFSNPAAAMDGLYLGPYGNGASLMQSVTSTGRSIVLEGGVANGGAGVRQSVIVNRGAFQFGTGVGY